MCFLYADASAGNELLDLTESELAALKLNPAERAKALTLIQQIRRRHAEGADNIDVRGVILTMMLLSFFRTKALLHPPRRVLTQAKVLVCQLGFV